MPKDKELESSENCHGHTHSILKQQRLQQQCCTNHTYYIMGEQVAGMFIRHGWRPWRAQCCGQFAKFNKFNKVHPSKVGGARLYFIPFFHQKLETPCHLLAFNFGPRITQSLEAHQKLQRAQDCNSLTVLFIPLWVILT